MRKKWYSRTLRRTMSLTLALMLGITAVPAAEEVITAEAFESEEAAEDPAAFDMASDEAMQEQDVVMIEEDLTPGLPEDETLSMEENQESQEFPDGIIIDESAEEEVLQAQAGDWIEVDNWDELASLLSPAVELKAADSDVLQITLTEDIIWNENCEYSCLNVYVDAVIDLNGHRIDRCLTPNSSDHYSVFENHARLTLCDNSDRRGVITGGNYSGIANFRDLKLEHVEISGNYSDEDGGGLYNSSDAYLADCSIVDNRSASNGGGIANYGELLLEKAVIRGNTADGEDSLGGGIYTDNDIYIGQNNPGDLIVAEAPTIDITIQDNTAAGKTSNVYFDGWSMLNFQPGISLGSSKIGVTTQYPPFYGDKWIYFGYQRYLDNKASLSAANFTSDEGYDVHIDEYSEPYLALPKAVVKASDQTILYGSSEKLSADLEMPACFDLNNYPGLVIIPRIEITSGEDVIDIDEETFDITTKKIGTASVSITAMVVIPDEPVAVAEDTGDKKTDDRMIAISDPAVATIHVVKDLSPYTVSDIKDSYTYSGSGIEPVLTVTDENGNALKKDTDYTVSYSNNLVPGTATVTIAGTGDYIGSITKNFTILVSETIAMTKANHSGSKLKLGWSAVSGADGYDVYVQYCGKNFKSKPTKSVKKDSLALKKLNKKKLKSKEVKYLIKAYKIVNGSKVVVAVSQPGHIAPKNSKKYTNPKNLKTAAGSITLAPGAKQTIIASSVKSKKARKLLNHALSLRYTTSDPNVATVSPYGEVTAVDKGTCWIIVYMINSKALRVQVTVQ